MNIQVAVICDAATDDNGKLNLLGSFDTIFAPQLPAVHPQCAVALRVTFNPGDEGPHKLKLHFGDADGRSILLDGDGRPMPPIEIPLNIALPDDVHFLTRNFVFNFQRLKFDEAGAYSADVLLDDRPQASIPLMVRHVPRPVA